MQILPIQSTNQVNNFKAKFNKQNRHFNDIWLNASYNDHLAKLINNFENSCPNHTLEIFDIKPIFPNSLYEYSVFNSTTGKLKKYEIGRKPEHKDTLLYLLCTIIEDNDIFKSDGISTMYQKLTGQIK